VNPSSPKSLPSLGPKEFRLKGKIYRRTDIQIRNKRGLLLECSHFEPIKRVAAQLPCVIYLHGNCSSRVEALQAVEVLLPSNITLFCFDFAGCGKSEGEYISLGWHERDDVEAAMDYLRKSETVTSIGLWGRSMGAVTAIMHADRDPTIGGIVLDSPFSDLKVLSEELVKTHTKIPKLIASGAMLLIRNTIKGKAKFDINDLVPMNHVEAGFVPAMFIAGKDDKFIDPRHSKDLYNKYAGDKNLVLVEGDHNTMRPLYLIDSVCIFFHNALLVDQLPKEEPKSQPRTSNPQKSESKGALNSFLSGIGFGNVFGGNKDNNQKKEEAAFAQQSKKIGNEEEIHEALGDINEEELRKAIEESIKLSGPDAAVNINEEKIVEKVEINGIGGREEEQKIDQK